MTETLPYMMSTAAIGKILSKIKDAATPDRFSQDFLSTVLGFPGGGPKPFIPLAKRLGLLNSDGSPTDLYRKFRGSDDESGAAMAAAIRIGYAPLYKRNEFADKLDRKKLEGLIKEITGSETGSSTLTATVSTFEALKKFAKFDVQLESSTATDDESLLPPAGERQVPPPQMPPIAGGEIRFGYTINLNLPNTNDIAVFNAIFKSLREHLL